MFQEAENTIAQLKADVMTLQGEPRLTAAELERVRAILAGAPPEPVEEPEGPVNPEDIVVSPADNLQEAINDANGKKIWLKDGVYSPVKLLDNTQLIAINQYKAEFTGAVNWSDGWTKSGDAWSKPFTQPLYQHPAKRVHGTDDAGNGASARGLAHRKAQQPHLLTANEVFMRAVYSKQDLKPGCFWLEGTASAPVRIWAMFPGGADPSSLRIRMAIHQRIISARYNNVSGVVLDGLFLREAANTTTVGALELPSDSEGWEVRNTLVKASNSEGVVLRGKGHLIENTVASYHGQTGFVSYGLMNSVLRQCVGSYNVWKDGIDCRWHSGNKFTNSSYNEFYGFTSHGNNGPGIWLDISNLDNIIDGFEVDGSLFAGAMLEHHSHGSVREKAQLLNGRILNTRRIPGTQHNGSGLVMQSGVNNWLIAHLTIEGNEDGAVYYKKDEDRGLSGFNTFQDITYTGNGNGNRWAVQGDMNVMPDTYNMPKPNFSNWK